MSNHDKAPNLLLKARSVLLFFILSGGLAHAELEEVIVTTERVAESVQDVPHSVAVIDADIIESLGIDSIESFYHIVPGLNLAPIAGDRTGVRLFIRGVGSTDALIGQDSSVSVYRDGVYQSRSQALNISYSDIERIEVLKGPHGTLYGRNTVGGSINIITRRATTEQTHGKVGIGVGSYALRSLDGMINVPFSDNLAVKLVAFSEAQDGWIENLSNDPDFSGHNHSGFRVDFVFDNNDNFRFDYSIDRSSARDSGYFYQPQPSDLSTGLNPIFANEGVYSSFSPRRVEQINGSNRDNLADSMIQTARLEWDFAQRHAMKLLLGHSTSSSRSYTNFDNAYNNEQLSRILSKLTEESNLSETALIARYSQAIDPDVPLNVDEINFNDAVRGYNLLLEQYHPLLVGTADTIGVNQYLESIGEPTLPTYRPIEQIRPYDRQSDGAAVFGRSTERGRPFDNDSVSIELQFVGDGSGGELSYIAGLFYFREVNDYAQYAGQNDFLEWLSGIDIAWTQRLETVPRVRLTNLISDAGNSWRAGDFAAAAQHLRQANNLIAPLAQVDGNLMLEGGSVNAEFEGESSSVAAYGNLNYAPSQSWDFTFGLRLSFDERLIDTRRFDPIGGGISQEHSHELSRSFNHVNYHLVARYRPNEDSNLYLTLTSSYRAGGYNETFTSTNPDDLLFEKEEIRGYELGYKAAFGSSVRLSSAVYYYQLPNQQYAVFNPFNPTQRSTVNSDALILGLDIELLVEIVEDWNLILAYANLERSADSFINPFDSERSYPVAIQSPHNSVNFAVNGRIPFADLYEMAVRLGLDYNSKYNIVENISQDAYLLVRLDINFVLDAFTLSLWSNNLTDTSYIIDGLPFAASTGTGPDLAIYGQPRTFGFKASYTF